MILMRLFPFFLCNNYVSSTDIGGYVFGKIFKGPKLTKISPKKTYAGMIGGIFLSLIFTNFI
jgi:phosphatidate cytidylyltransferase